MALLTTRTCPKFIGLLGEFYDSRPMLPLEARLVDAAELPQPARRLLVHESDMTSTLEAYHGERLMLRVLERKVTPEMLTRHIVLVGVESGRPVEYGAARIRLGVLGAKARAMVLECLVPLGTILHSEHMDYTNCPGGYFRIRSNELIGRALNLGRPETLYGRCNCLWDFDGRTIAEVVEILPPAG